MERDKVYMAVDRERAYQESKWGGADVINNVGDFLIYMQRELEKARDAYVAPDVSTEAAMAGIRKVATVGFAAMEKFGTGTPR